MKRPTMEDIMVAACESYGVDEEYITQYRRLHEVVIVRQAVHYLTRVMTNEIMRDIAVRTGIKNHSTVFHSVKCVMRDYGRYPDITNLIDKIYANLKEKGFCTKSEDQLRAEAYKKKYRR